MIEHLQTHNNNDFIKGWYIKDTNICDKLINYIETNNNAYQGRSSNGVDTNVKDSLDCHLDNIELLQEYVNQLMQVASAYTNVFPFANYYDPWGINDVVNIQRYLPGQGYHEWHTERTGTHPIPSTRHLVFMTYLNDVNDGGETEFYHQNIKVKPEKGLTLIWPADWTYTHRGVPSTTETKYIVTGWFNYFGGER
jgi:hypothetical protein